MCACLWLMSPCRFPNSSELLRLVRQLVVPVVPKANQGRQERAQEDRSGRLKAGRLIAMVLPDLAPWFDNASDDYHELPCGDHEAPYDE